MAAESMISEGYRQAYPFLLVVVLLYLYFLLPAHADGGAPNLAYVAGTSSGVSVIDVGQAKVTQAGHNISLSPTALPPMSRHAGGTYSRSISAHGGRLLPY